MLKQVEINIKYKGYIDRELLNIRRLSNLENYSIKKDTNYLDIKGLKYETQEKLSNIRPDTLGQASRVAGISPADISILMIYLKQN